MVITLRPYRPADARPTREVFEAAIHGTASAFYTKEQIEAWCPSAYDQEAWDQARARAWTIVAETKGRVVGFSDLTNGGELDMLFVEPAASGRGVARHLVSAVLMEAAQRGLARVTTQASRAARPAFEQLGFVVDRANPNNVIRGIAVPNFAMHICLPDVR